jgi:hypothetical protein
MDKTAILTFAPNNEDGGDTCFILKGGRKLKKEKEKPANVWVAQKAFFLKSSLIFLKA